jgi:hypothetical protein
MMCQKPNFGNKIQIINLINQPWDFQAYALVTIWFQELTQVILFTLLVLPSVYMVIASNRVPSQTENQFEEEVSKA